MLMYMWLSIYLILSTWFAISIIEGILDKKFVLKYYHLLFPFSFVFALILFIFGSIIMGIANLFIKVFKFLRSPIFKSRLDQEDDEEEYEENI